MVTIYFILDRKSHSIKIGRTSDLKSRLATLQTSNVSSLRILYTLENVESNFEQHLHGICKRYHLRGEWFRTDVIDHLLNHPFYLENLKPFKGFGEDPR